jgi:hypothetical protein
VWVNVFMTGCVDRSVTGWVGEWISGCAHRYMGSVDESLKIANLRTLSLNL